MKVAFITHYTHLYGANRSLLNLIDGLSKYKVSAHVVSPGEGDMAKILQDRGVPVAIMPIQRWMSKRPSSKEPLRWIFLYALWLRNVLRRFYRNFRLLPALAQQLREWEIDVIYTNSSVIPIGALAAWKLRLPHVWHMREFSDLDYDIYPDWGTSIFRRIIGSADALISISEAVSSHLLNGVANERVHIIYNGIASEADFDRFYKMSQTKSRHKEHYTFALVGLIHPNKGQETAIRALAIVAKQYPDTHLLIVGGGDTTALERIVSELGMENNIEFWGYVKEPYAAYLAADATLVCSKYEAMGRVTAEAMSACLPVIGFDHAGTSEIIEHEHTGLFYRGGPEELAACMIRFIKNPGWASQLGYYGWHIARKKYSTEVYAENVYRVLCSITHR
ncbi:MAG TPA: glycosyltransferase family 4 protein [Desulfobacteraceae bacterium]|nr:glycosyltransferase family 4 protein [Desulfobacteraceae bacterium]HPJ67539.1 glycosyltransferase family 4 protein [Desulfobacteraceae bacterium]HPQ28496.1 glycosyltransferase family 4 protein [Desulfobacteraceae bacterium]